jgi:glutaredoxin-related protein
MSRQIFNPEGYHPRAKSAIDKYFTSTIEEISAAVGRDPIVIVGMAQNPHVKRARRALGTRPYTYLEYGSYFGEWKRRLAIKMWAGWPTFPMVFVGGKLLGGADELEAALAAGELDKLLTAEGGHG